MRKSNDLEPRISAAATTGDAATASWMPANELAHAALDPAHWSRRARQERYWRMVEIWNRQRRFH